MFLQRMPTMAEIRQELIRDLVSQKVDKPVERNTRARVLNNTAMEDIKTSLYARQPVYV